jgi:hypothetical protein
MTVEPIRNAFNSHEDTRMHRLWNQQTRRYLHLSGTGETPDVALSWLGYAHQADMLRARTLADSKPWPYVRRSRNAAQVAVPSFDQVEL